MKKRILTLLVCLVMLVALVSGCTREDATTTETDKPMETKDEETKAPDKEVETEEVTISFWTLSSRQDGVEAILDGFSEKYPNITVEVSFDSTDGHKQNIKVAASSGSLPSLWFNWGGSLGGFYTENGLTYDLTDYAAANNWAEKFDGAALDLSTLHGQLAGYPTSLSMVGIYYRKDVFEQYGIQVPSTFEEFEAACAILKENGVTPLSTAGSGAGWHVMRMVEQLVEYYAGADLHDSMNTFNASYDNDAVVKALAKFQEWCELGYFNEGFVTSDPGEVLAKLYTGEAAMATEGQWAERNYLKAEQDPELYGYFPFPSGGTNRMSAFVEMYQFNANLSDAELDACVKFMDYYYGKEAIEANPGNYKYPCPINGIGIPDANVNTKLMVEDIAVNGSFTITDQAFPPEVSDVLFSVQDELALGTMTPEEGAAAIQEAIENYLANK